MDHSKKNANSRNKNIYICHNIIMVTVLLQNDFRSPTRAFIDNTISVMKINNDRLVYSENILKMCNLPQHTRTKKHIRFPKTFTLASSSEPELILRSCYWRTILLTAKHLNTWMNFEQNTSL